MDPLGWLPAAAALAIALATAFVLSNYAPAPSNSGRFASIDGLRGYLAFFVFLHHSAMWYFYLRSGKWEALPSKLFYSFGKSSLALFFMITGFLFFLKIMDGRVREIDWTRLYISRILRLVPLYWAVVGLVFVLVMVMTKATLYQPIPSLLSGAAKWLSFTALGAPDLNGFQHTFTMVAGVTWSLAYEWMFYLLLPAIAVLVGVRPPLVYLALALCAVVFVASHPGIEYLWFTGGMAAGLLVRSDLVRRIAVHKLSTILAVACLAASVALSPGHAMIRYLLMTVFFTLAAGGNTLFGALTNSVSRMLGEFSYGIYLLHGLLLFVTFHFVLGLPAARSLSALEHWGVILAITPVLVFAAFLSHRFIEHPAMQLTPKAVAWVRTLRLGSAASR